MELQLVKEDRSISLSEAYETVFSKSDNLCFKNRSFSRNGIKKRILSEYVDTVERLNRDLKITFTYEEDIEAFTKLANHAGFYAKPIDYSKGIDVYYYPKSGDESHATISNTGAQVFEGRNVLKGLGLIDNYFRIKESVMSYI